MSSVVKRSITQLLCGYLRVQAAVTMDEVGGYESTEGVRVVFSCCKAETHTHKQGFKQLFRRLRSMYR